MKYPPEKVFYNILESLETPDNGRDAVIRSLYSAEAESDAVGLALDLAALLRRRNDPILAAEVILQVYIYYGGVSALRELTNYFLGYRDDLRSGKNAEIRCAFVDFVKWSITDEAKRPKADFPNRYMNVEELSALFLSVERLCACGVLVDSDLLALLATQMHTKYDNHAYKLIRKYSRFYGAYQSKEDLTSICNQRQKLVEESKKLVSSNSDLCHTIRYLLAVSHGKSYLGAGNSSTHCSKCMSDDTGDDVSLSKMIYRMEQREFEPLCTQDGNYDCLFCPDIPTCLAEDGFVESVLDSMSIDSYIPSARLFWDIHDGRPISHAKRMDIVAATPSCWDIYDIACPAHPVLSSSFAEKT